MNQRIDWSNGPVQCKEDGCSTMLRPSGCKPEGQWTDTRRCVGRGRCLKHWREVAVREKADAMQAQRRAAGRPTKKGLVVRRSAGEAVVTWPVPPEGEELWLEKKLLTQWARQALDRDRYPGSPRRSGGCVSGNVQSGRRRDLWQALTPLQQSEALRLTVAVIASAVSGSARAVASCLAEAGRVAPQVEAHVLWAARELTGPMRLVGDTESVSSRWLEEGARVRARQRRTSVQEGLFS